MSMVEISPTQQRYLEAIAAGHNTREKLRRYFKRNNLPCEASKLIKMGLVEVDGYEIKHISSVTIVADLKVQTLRLTGKPYKVVRKEAAEKRLAQKAVVALQKVFHCINSRIFWAETHADSKSQTIAEFCRKLKELLTQKQESLKAKQKER